MIIYMDSLDEVEDLVGWNLSFGISCEETLKYVDISEVDKQYIRELFIDYE